MALKLRLLLYVLTVHCTDLPARTDHTLQHRLCDKRIGNEPCIQCHGGKCMKACHVACVFSESGRVSSNFCTNEAPLRVVDRSRVVAAYECLCRAHSVQPHCCAEGLCHCALCCCTVVLGQRAMHSMRPVIVLMLSLLTVPPCTLLETACAASSLTHAAALPLLTLLLLLLHLLQSEFEITINPTNPADQDGALHYRVYCHKHANGTLTSPSMVPPTAIRFDRNCIPKARTQDESRRLVSHTSYTCSTA
jgi:hypothetical protein